MSEVKNDINNIIDSINKLKETKENVDTLKNSLTELFKVSDLSADGIENIINTMPTLVSEFKSVIGPENLGREKCYPLFRICRE